MKCRKKKKRKNLLWLPKGKEGRGWIGRLGLTYIMNVFSVA